jgi:aryl-alcohol dehydrogenase-like predicted oxidoreductase
VVQFHSSPSQRTLQDNRAVDALLKLKDAGKVRFIGMSGTFPRTKPAGGTAPAGPPSGGP